MQFNWEKERSFAIFYSFAVSVDHCQVTRSKEQSEEKEKRRNIDHRTFNHRMLNNCIMLLSCTVNFFSRVYHNFFVDPCTPLSHGQISSFVAPCHLSLQQLTSILSHQNYLHVETHLSKQTLELKSCWELHSLLYLSSTKPLVHFRLSKKPMNNLLCFLFFWIWVVNITCTSFRFVVGRQHSDINMNKN